ncbi:MAG: Multiple resistance and pH homeostasis protein G [Candidatus Accumulibacter appositus]|uniref:Multiple resistance and pH homeostasis protein G n=1 Tax=Candidatus Accumulibacter appositus TaxID=1454003 RepID=A0A011PV31_9PROT|nr:Na+/H+ antiporter subunit G [Accumulibacter sp.]EXI80892.1 MAG: Multiple resistance and pH homeostasis protein G [Candidatus Accumulibacter appositus]HRF03851.1 Na+/H+ antiporter subunit G [Accumulibacter sp.]
MSTATELIISTLIVLGALFVLLGSVGLARLPDFFMRLHGPTKATTMGVGATLLASAIFFSVQDRGVSLHELAPLFFLFITAPVTAHLLAKAALHRKSSGDTSGQAAQASEHEPGQH